MELLPDGPALAPRVVDATFADIDELAASALEWDQEYDRSVELAGGSSTVSADARILNRSHPDEPLAARFKE